LHGSRHSSPYQNWRLWRNLKDWIFAVFIRLSAMLLEMLQGKIHQGAVTACRVDYEGSLTVDIDLIEQAGLRIHQKIQLLNINNGERIETYLIEGERGKREIIVNGAAARLFYRGDRVIIAGYALLDAKELVGFKPQVIVLNQANEIVERH
jgi:aspartate 1-decarboxylase